MDGLTLGVEEEFQIVDLDSGELVPRSDDLLPLARQALGDRVTAELNRCQIEVATPVCTGLGEVRTALTHLRRTLDRAAAGIGCGILPVGTHPWSSWRDQAVEADHARFRQMEDEYQVIARQQVICGCHVHVGIADPDLAVAIMSRIRPWLPVLLALSANSPFWSGTDTGYDSYRLEVWERWPTAGVPPDLTDRAAYDEVVDELRTGGAIDDATHLYWYLRPSDRWPTLEFRAMDVALDVDTAVAVAGLARGLVGTEIAALERGEAALDTTPEMVGAALWRAARYGLEGELVSPNGGEPQPAAAVVAELLAVVGGALDETGDRTAVSTLVAGILARGNGASRQRSAVAADGGLESVVAMARGSLARAD